MHDSEAKAVGEAGIAFLEYLKLQWMPTDMWTSWSRSGKESAAIRIGIPFMKVLTTTNHLESFNGLLKGKYLENLTQSGYRLRLDVLVYHLSQRILPRVYAQRRLDYEYIQWRAKRFLLASGGNVVLPQRHSCTHAAQ